MALHQLHPLLVHALLFGGGYGGRAVAVARGLV
jgi:fructosamine-3-kinase